MGEQSPDDIVAEKFAIPNFFIDNIEFGCKIIFVRYSELFLLSSWKRERSRNGALLPTP